ncbi:hypothetical protein BGX24_006746, partial [Mortierella sp. AD032]
MNKKSYIVESASADPSSRPLAPNTSFTTTTQKRHVDLTEETNADADDEALRNIFANQDIELTDSDQDL